MLPVESGTYALVLRLAAPTTLRVMGRPFDLLPGRYVYVGSARGPGGVRARLGRHVSGGSSPHWHVDVLRAVSDVESWAYSLDAAVTECRLAQALAALPCASIPIPRFGARDCRAHCPAHLVVIPTDVDLIRLWATLLPSDGSHPA